VPPKASQPAGADQWNGHRTRGTHPMSWLGKS